MNFNTENLNKFFDRVKEISFWKRIFGWSEIKSLSYDAYEEFKSLINSLNMVSEKLNHTLNELSLIKKDVEQTNMLKSETIHLKEKEKEKNDELTVLKGTIEALNEKIKNTNSKTNELDKELFLKKKELEIANNQNSVLTKENTIFKQTSKEREREYSIKINELLTTTERLKEAEKRVHDERENKIKIDFESKKQTWIIHEQNVEHYIKSICQKYTIEYLDKEKVPFRNKPDNTLKICNEFIVFDAKSPASDDLDNFNNYIKLQTESIKKYVKEENVKKEVFLVVPTNTVDVIKQFTYTLADYNVYVITPDSIEPIVLCLKKIEEYEFAEQLTPEDRENICRTIGKLLYTTKRKIQVDQFFIRHFISLVSQSETSLPDDIFKDVEKYEKAEIINPTLDKRGKVISTEKLSEESSKIQREAEAKNIFPDSLEPIKKLPLTNQE